MKVANFPDKGVRVNGVLGGVDSEESFNRCPAFFAHHVETIRHDEPAPCAYGGQQACYDAVAALEGALTAGLVVYGEAAATYRLAFA